MRNLIILFLFFTSFYSLAQEKSNVFAVSDGKGNIKLFWMVPPEKFPEAGFKIEDETNKKILEEKFIAGREEFLKNLTEEEREISKNFLNLLKEAKESKEKSFAFFTILLNASSNWEFAKALGIAYEINESNKGKRIYKITGIGQNLILKSELIDPFVLSFPPLSPENFKAEIVEGGVFLNWKLGKGKGFKPFSFYIERDEVKINDKPVIMSGIKGEEVGNFLDEKPPVLKEVSYYVYGFDIFGRKSNIAKTSIYVPDFKAMVPPKDFIAEAKDGKVVLKWKKQENSSGYVIERSYLTNGPYEVLTPKGLEPAKEFYEDKNVVGGTVYYYRIHCYGKDGKVGPPSQVVFAQAKNQEPPPKPKNLKAKAGRTKVHLWWEAVNFPIAGYRIERKSEGKEKWDKLNEELALEAEYDDKTGLHTQGEFKYRVIAIAYDNKESLPSDEISVELLDTVSPNPPRITDIESNNGKIKIYFEASPPIEDVDKFLIIRGVSEEDPGFVIGAALPKDKREFEDGFVKIGQRYWYRIAALDKVGNRSELSHPKNIVAIAPDIPKAEKPSLLFKEKPIRHIVIKFKKVDYPFFVVVQKKVNEKWISISGVLNNMEEFVDLKIPEKGALQYRIFYILENNISGEPSDLAEIKIP